MGQSKEEQRARLIAKGQGATLFQGKPPRKQTIKKKKKQKNKKSKHKKKFKYKKAARPNPLDAELKRIQKRPVD